MRFSARLDFLQQLLQRLPNKVSGICVCVWVDVDVDVDVGCVCVKSSRGSGERGESVRVW